MRWWKTALLVVLLAASMSFYGCVSVMLPAVPDRVTGPAAEPPLLDAHDEHAAVTTPEDWTSRRAPEVRAALETTLYGRMPPARTSEVITRKVVERSAFDGLGRVEQITLQVGATEADRMNLAIALPADAPGPVPIILMQTFCGNAAAFTAHSDVNGVDPPLAGYQPFCDSSWADPLVTAVFGRYHNGPPFKDLLEHGYAVGLMYPAEVVPDAPGPGFTALNRLGARQSPRWGAIAAWAWLYSRAVDYVDSDPRFDPARTAIWGHSRNGKSALVAAAWDPRIDAVVAHQSGTGGATLSRSYAGESVEEITTGYPHWFTPAFADFGGREEELPIDQHALLALIAPRPVLLGNAIRDAWSDPEGAFRSARAADEVYELLGSNGLEQDTMGAANMNADLAFFLRPGTHGVRTQDWRYFLEFLDAHFAPDEDA